MKNLLLVLVLSIGLSSCHHDDDHIIVIEFPTTDVVLNVKAEARVASRTSVNRGDIPATVENIDVTITSNVSPIEVSEIFELVDDGTGADGFVINDVALGSNDVVASTTTVANGSFEVSQFHHHTTAQDKLDENKAEVPFALYNGEVLNYVVTGTSDFINVDMTTNNGRINTVVVMDESIQDDYTYQVAYFTTANPTAQVFVPTQSNKGVSIYWSDEDSVAGQNIIIGFYVYDLDGNQVYSDSSVTTVLASTGINTLYTLTADSVQAESVGFDFIFQEWIEIDN